MTRIMFLGGLMGLVLLWAGADGVAHGPPHRGLSPLTRQAIYDEPPRFTLITQGGERLAVQDLWGKVVLVNFIYTSCPDVCPLATAKFRRIQHLLRVRGLQEQVYLLSISTDPAIDTPAVLMAYGRRHRVDFSFWAFLTGSSGEVARVWDRFGVVAVARGRGDIDHSSMTFLLDRTGRLRLIYLGYGWREEDVAKDMAGLLEEG
ncbi:MAG: SCO family protein [candidate division NC10 bacterium]|nr:SCO family protein [candidate division NC10 bacterium]